MVIENCKKYNFFFYLMGFLLDGGVYSYNIYFYVFLEFVKKYNFEKVYVYCFLDG